MVGTEDKLCLVKALAPNPTVGAAGIKAHSGAVACPYKVLIVRSHAQRHTPLPFSPDKRPLDSFHLLHVYL